jgi:SAM-dependent methyltransferase
MGVPQQIQRFRMALPPAQRNAIEGMQERASRDSQLEMEFTLPGMQATGQFKEAIQTWRPDATDVLQESAQLDILGERVRATVAGKDAVQAFLRSPTQRAHMPLVWIRKHKEQQSVDVSEYGFRCHLKREEPLPVQEVDPIKFLASPTLTLRLKRRISLRLASHSCAIDLTVVNMVEREALKDAVRLVASAPAQLECEVEYLPGLTVPQETTRGVTELLLEVVASLLCIIQRSRILVPLARKTQLMTEYTALVRGVRGIRGGVTGGGGGDKVTPPRLIGPQLVTLTRRNLLPPARLASMPGRWVSVLSGDYTVTDKTDGERCLMMVSGQDGEVFLLDDRLNVRAAGLVQRPQVSGACVLDGELLWRSNRYVAFDAYVVDGASVMSLPLSSTDASITTRLSLVRAVLSRLSPSSPDAAMSVLSKVFHSGTGAATLLGHCRDILLSSRSAELSYDIDGLIFTPSHLPVGALFPDGAPEPFGRWPLAFKWKPPHQNTIDFLVIQEGTVPFKNRDGTPSVRFHLYVGADLSRQGDLDPMDVLLRRLPAPQAAATSARGGRYGVVPFRPQRVLPPDDDSVSYLTVSVLDGKQHARCLNGEALTSHTVVECSFVNTRWVPNLVRADKTEKMKRLGQSGPNDISTAMSVWRTIMEPVTEAMITGADPDIAVLDEQDDGTAYYQQQTDVERSRSASIAMRSFHNHIKQSVLVNTCVDTFGDDLKVCEVACGRGGELSKWLNGGVRTLLGLDINRRNLYAVADSAYARLVERLQPGSVPDDLRVVFLQMDCGKVMDAHMLQSLPTKPERLIASMLWATVPSAQVQEPILHKYYGMAKDGFQVVSCQFAVHYFFGDLDTLRNFVNNVATLLRPGGLFVGTCLDAFAVHRLFEERGVRDGQHVSQTLGSRSIWYLKRKYGDDALSSTDPSVNLGVSVDVYMETFSAPFTEFLVDHRLLEQELARVNILPWQPPAGSRLGVYTDMFSNTFAQLSRTPDLQGKKLQLILGMQEEEKSYSFLNRWFVFQKQR